MADINTLIKDINKRFGVNAIRKGADINDEMNFKKKCANCIKTTDTFSNYLID